MKKYTGEDFFEEKYIAITKAIDYDDIRILNTLITKENINHRGKRNLTFIFYAFLSIRQ